MNAGFCRVGDGHHCTIRWAGQNFAWSCSDCGAGRSTMGHSDIDAMLEAIQHSKETRPRRWWWRFW